MKVTVDNIWATPSALHLRVHVWGNDNKWHVKEDVHVPLDEIPEQAVAAMWLYYGDGPVTEEMDEPLF